MRLTATLHNNSTINISIVAMKSAQRKLLKTLSRQSIQKLNLGGTKEN
jgi:hypothetical protein